MPYEAEEVLMRGNKSLAFLCAAQLGFLRFSVRAWPYCVKRLEMLLLSLGAAQIKFKRDLQHR